MPRITIFATLLLACVGTAALADDLPLAVSPAIPQPAPAPAAMRTFTLEAGLSRVIQLGAAVDSVSAADPRLVEVHPASATTLLALGVAPGRTTITALNAAGQRVAQYDVTVWPSRHAVPAAHASVAPAPPVSDVVAAATDNGLPPAGPPLPLPATLAATLPATLPATLAATLQPVISRQPAMLPTAAPWPATPRPVSAPRAVGLTGMRGITLEAGLGRVLQLGAAATSVFAADPKVVEVRPASATTLFAFGVAPGHTTIAALDAAGHPVGQYDVTVSPSHYAALAAHASIARALPDSDVAVATTGNGLVATGRLGTASEAEQAMQAVRGSLPPGQLATDNLAVRGSVQVNLRVRIVEMGRTLTRDLGVNWSALSNIGSYATFAGATSNLISNLTTPTSAFGLNARRLGINGVIDALAQDQLVHLLAEPNLTALSGETASFLVGGEFPIPVAQQNNQTTIEFKQYGVSLAFVPTVMSNGDISLQVRPEVSQLTTQGAVQLSSGNSTIQVPALTVRRAETTVELGSGQSFAIAGLLQDNATISDSAVPFLGELPILGALFRSDAFQRNETELVIIVTPYIVRPVSNPAALATPIDGNPLPNDFERLLLLRQTGRVPAAGATAGLASARRPIDAGFVVQ